MNVIIIDDESNARAALRGMIEENFPEIVILGEAENLITGVELIRNFKPDLVLLDIEMPGHLGIDILDFFKAEEINFEIVFVTAYNDYALRAFELAAVDYLLKPTRMEHLKRAFNKVDKTLGKAPSQINFNLLKEFFEKKELDKIAFNVGEGIQVVETSEILYLQASSSYTHVFLSNGSKLTISKTLQEFNGLELQGSFFRINRSYIVNVGAISKISKKNGGFVLMKDGTEISASVEKRQQLYTFFGDRIF